MKMKYGYARVSTTGQDLRVQEEELKAANCECVFSEKYTGTTMERPVFRKLLKVLQSGDTLVVTKLDRLARNTIGALNITKELFSRNVRVTILNMGTIEDTPTGNLMLTMISAFAQFERDMIVSRTQEGKNLARRINPNYTEGRKNKYSDEQIESALNLWKEDTVEHVSEVTGISISTLYRRRRCFL